MSATLIRAPGVITTADSGGSGTWGDAGAPGSSFSDVLVREGTHSRAKGTNSTTQQTILYSLPGNINLSGETLFNLSSHVGFWVWVTNPQSLRSKDSAGFTTIIGNNVFSFDEHYVLGNDNYPKDGGWKKVWVALGRTPDAVIGSGLIKSTAKIFGARYNFSEIIDSAQNVALDAIHFTRYASRTFLIAGGDSASPATFQDAIDIDDSGSYGSIFNRGNSIILDRILQLGDSVNPIYFDDSDKTFLFGDQPFAEPPRLLLDATNVNTRININKVAFCSTGTVNSGNFSFTGDDGEINISDCSFKEVSQTFNSLAININNCSYNKSYIQFLNASALNNCTFSNYVGPVAAISWGVTGLPVFPGDTSGKLDNANFISSGTGHAIFLSQYVDSELTFNGHSYNGYATVDGSTGNEVLYNNSGKDVTIIVRGGDVPTVRNGTGSTTTIKDIVDIDITIRSAVTFELIEDARVLVTVDSGGPGVFEEPVSITSSGTTATINHANHGFTNDISILVDGATEVAYNGVFSINVLNDSNYTYTLPSTASSPATGSPNVTQVVIYGLSDSNGNLFTEYSFEGEQPIIGKVRKSSSSPYYKSTPIIGEISETGFASTSLLIPDE